MAQGGIGGVIDRLRKLASFQIRDGLVLVTVFLLMFGLFWFTKPASGSLSIVASGRSTQDSRGKSWVISGTVLGDDGKPRQAEVWAIASDERGRSFSKGLTTTSNTGSFELAPIPADLAGDNELVSKVVVYARQGSTDESVGGKLVISLGSRNEVQVIQVSPKGVAILASIFFGSILLGLYRPVGGTAKLINHNILIVLSLALTVAMLITMALGLSFVNERGRAGQIFSLGYAHIFEGTYIKDVQPEWIFSLTSPTRHQVASALSTNTGSVENGAANKASTTPPGPTPTQGLGAPLWVILMAVVGSVLFTISLIVKQVRDLIDFNNDSQVSERKEEIVRHQFYTLFSPIGAIIVYQMLVAAESAKGPVMVALCVMAAGVGINLLLDKAVKAMQQMLSA